jgi:hypothetical protein
VLEAHEAWCQRQDECLRKATAEIHRSLNDKTYKVCVARITREYAYIALRAPNARAAENVAKDVVRDDRWREPGHEIEWMKDEGRLYSAASDETEETKDLPWFIVHGDGSHEEVQTCD